MPLSAGLLVAILATAAPEPAASRPALFSEGGVTISGGRFDGPRSADGAGAMETAYLWGWERAAFGLRLSLENLGAGYGIAGGLVGGPLLDLRDTVRLEVLGDVGLSIHSVSDEDLVVVSQRSSGGTAGLPTAGLRAGLKFHRRGGGLAFTLGAMVRWVQPETVEYDATSCLLAWCTTSRRSVGYGGTTIGGYLTVSRLKQLAAP